MRLLATIGTMVFAGSLLLAGARVEAAESYDNCRGFISAVPATIATPGVWCVDRHLVTAMASGTAIAVTGSNITIDCNHFRLSGTAGAATTAIGIGASARTNVTVRNCSVRGFRYGAQLSGTGHVVEDSRFDASTSVGIEIDADLASVRRNLVADTGGSTIAGSAMGIYVTGSADIADNTVSGVVATAGTGAAAHGIYSNLNAAGQIAGNRVRGVVGDSNDYGIWGLSTGRLVLRANDVVAESGTGLIGIRCTTSSARAVDNVVLGFATSLSNCGNDGNVLVP
jgi:hypothetical protein